ncbi:hypothetical protein ACN20G_34065 (plasmid) [Streptomyces sp. BI20]|uniref:hypothetical protein n=1 Tax=Streptomyces sp. BI20 TaxID=3403460 RepID=UPI003C761904
MTDHEPFHRTDRRDPEDPGAGRPGTADLADALAPAPAEPPAARYPGEATEIAPEDTGDIGDTEDIGEADPAPAAGDPAHPGSAPHEHEHEYEYEREPDPGPVLAAETAGDTSLTTDRDGPANAEDDEARLLAEQDALRFRDDWREIQTRFVDDPRGVVRDADRLVAEVMRTLAESFATHKRELEGEWNEGEEPATEDLRLALRRYRSFFDRLLQT